MPEGIQLKNISDNNLGQCLKCSTRTTYCPASAVEPEYPGPKHSEPDLERYRLKDKKFFDNTLKMRLNCKRYEAACLSGVRIANIIQASRIKYSTHEPILRDRMLVNTDFVGTMANMAAPIVNTTLGPKPVKAVLHSVVGVNKHHSFSAYSSQKFETWHKRDVAKEQDNYKKHVGYFYGCYVDYNFPQLSKDLVKIMNAVGYGVHLLEKEKCCGVALIANGLSNQARKQGKVNISLTRQAANQNRAVLVTSSTRTFTTRDEYEHLLNIKVDDVKENITLATRFLYRLIGSGDVKLAFREDFRIHAAYHSACHMEKIGWVIYNIELLKTIPGLKLTMPNSQCCGIAGIYGFKKKNYERSQQIGSGVFKQIKRINPDYVTTDCEACKWQIETPTGYDVKNPISILAEALDVEKARKLNGIEQADSTNSNDKIKTKQQPYKIQPA